MVYLSDNCFRPRNRIKFKVRLLLSRPLFHPYDDYEFEKRFNEYNLLTKITAKEKSIPFIDIDVQFATESQYFSDAAHLNKQGLKRMAEMINSIIWPNGGV